MSIWCTVLLVRFLLPSGHACKSSSWYYYDTVDETNLNKSKKAPTDTHFNMISNGLWEGWKPDNETLEEWEQWLNEYEEEFKESQLGYGDLMDDLYNNGMFGNGGPFGSGLDLSSLYFINGTWVNGYYDANGTWINGTSTHFDYLKERGPGSGWPESWADLGPGYNGADPPPWAYGPKNVGKPSYCYKALQKGHCEDPTKITNTLRYAYHPYIDECVNFTYVGCLGNRNNFKTFEECYAKCMMMDPHQGCDPDSHIYIDEMIHH